MKGVTMNYQQCIQPKVRDTDKEDGVMNYQQFLHVKQRRIEKTWIIENITIPKGLRQREYSDTELIINIVSTWITSSQCTRSGQNLLKRAPDIL